jgi:hypothetical protein
VPLHFSHVPGLALGIREIVHGGTYWTRSTCHAIRGFPP